MRRLGMLGVTGTPGTGKKSVTPLLASLLGTELIDLNSLASTLSAPDPHGETLVDTKELGAVVVALGTAGAVVSGHLLADVLRSASIGFVAVLRCEPAVLKRRLTTRGYPPGKVLENVEAELIGVVLDGAVRRFGAAKVHEYDSTRSGPAALAQKIAADFRARKAQSSPWIDWTIRYDSSTRLRSLLSTPRTEPAST